MKSRLTTAFLVLSTVLLVMSGLALADSLTVTKIGALDLGGKKYSEWWYTAENPTFYGKADNSDTVTLKTGGKSYETQANINGDWDIPTALVKGDHSIVIASGDASYSFILHVGQEFTGGAATQASGSTSSVPATGTEQTTALTLGLGVSLLALYLYFSESTKKHKTFERKIVSDQ